MKIYKNIMQIRSIVKMVMAFFFSFAFIPLSIASPQVSVKKSIESTISDIGEGKGEWFFYEVEMEPSNGMPCCYQKNGSSQCDLNKRTNYWGTTIESSKQTSKVLRLYYQHNKGEVTDVFMAGSECVVTAEGKTIVELVNVDSEKSLEFLAAIIKNNTTNLQSSALAALAYHKGGAAQTYLQSFVDNSDSELRENAIFWMGKARNEAGFDSLNKLLNKADLTTSEKEKLIFSLSVNTDSRSVDKLLTYAKSSADVTLQSQSLFWLAQNKHVEVLPVIKKLLASQVDSSVLEKAIFALSQYRSSEAKNLLKEIAVTHHNNEARAKAIFWLSQEDGADNYELLVGIAEEANNPPSVSESAVFAISQLDSEIAAKGLIRLINGHVDKSIKKKAIFWLGENDSKRATGYIEELLER